MDHSDIVWGLIMSFWIGNIMLLFLNIPLIGLWVRLLQIPIHYLYPLILMFICIGTFAVRLSVFDLWLVILAGIFGILVRLAGLPVGPLLLGCVLGPSSKVPFRSTFA